MALPYGPIMRGLSISWCYGKVEDGLVSLTNPSGALILARNTRVLARETLDKRAVILSQGPTAVINIGQILMGNTSTYGEPEIVYELGTITHTGTGTGLASLSGRHSGNNSFAVEITSTGVVGTDGAYELTRTPWTGSAWGTVVVVSSGSIPLDGIITVGNGSSFSFTVGESVVEGDTYEWETESYRVTNRQIREAEAGFGVSIYAENEEEAIGEGGYLDQLMLMFSHKLFAEELYADHSEEVIEELKSMTFTKEVAGETTIYKIGLSLTYKGKVFAAEVSPLITLVTTQDPEILDPDEY